MMQKTKRKQLKKRAEAGRGREGEGQQFCYGIRYTVDRGII